MVKHVFPDHTILKHLSYSNFNYSFRFMMSANFSPVIQEVQISFLWRQEKMLQSCLRPTIPSVKLPPSKLFRILLGKLPTLEARFPLLPLPRPLIPPKGGGDEFGLIFSNTGCYSSLSTLILFRQRSESSRPYFLIILDCLH